MTRPRKFWPLFPLTLLCLGVLTGCPAARSNMSYTQLLTEIAVGNVSHVRISGDQATVTLHQAIAELDSTRITWRVQIPHTESQALFELLEEHRVPFEVTDD